MGPLGSRPEPVIGALSSSHSGLPETKCPKQPSVPVPYGRRPGLRPTGKPACPQPSEVLRSGFPAFAPSDQTGLHREPKPPESRGRSGRAFPFSAPVVDRIRHPTRINPLLEAVPGPVDPPPTSSIRRSPLSPFVPPKRNCGSVKGPLSTVLRRIGAGQLLGTKGNICTGCDAVNS